MPVVHLAAAQVAQVADRPVVQAPAVLAPVAPVPADLAVPVAPAVVAPDSNENESPAVGAFSLIATDCGSPGLAPGLSFLIQSPRRCR